MGFKEIINAIRQYPWQVTVAVISLIPLYIIDLKFLAKRKVGLSRKIEIAKERGHVTKGMIIKKDAKRITVNRSNSDYNYWAARYLHSSRKGVLQKILLFSAKQYQIPSADNHKCLLDP